MKIKTFQIITMLNKMFKMLNKKTKVNLINNTSVFDCLLQPQY